jgi:hypothetical protein
MKRFRPQISLAMVFGLLVIVSCAPDPLAGVYRSSYGELLKIDESGKVFWSPPTKTRMHSDDFRFLGILGRASAQEERHLVMPSTHPNLGTGMIPSPDGKTITVDWWERGSESPSGRSELFLKQEREQSPRG